MFTAAIRSAREWSVGNGKCSRWRVRILDRNVLLFAYMYDTMNLLYNTMYPVRISLQSRYNEIQYILYYCISVQIQWIQLRISPRSRYGGYLSYMFEASLFAEASFDHSRAG